MAQDKWITGQLVRGRKYILTNDLSMNDFYFSKGTELTFCEAFYSRYDDLFIYMFSGQDGTTYHCSFDEFPKNELEKFAVIDISSEASPMPNHQSLAGKAYFKWKELLVYEEDNKYLFFEAPMGVIPVNVYVPSPQKWEEVVPDWAKKHRKKILDIISHVEGLGKIMEEDNAWVCSE